MKKTQLEIALVGASGMLARKVQEKARAVGYTVSLFDLPDFNMTDRTQVLQEMTRLQPDVIINCAAFTNVDGAEKEQSLAMVVNGTAVGYLAEAALTVNAILVHVSTDYVFDGQKTTPYVEADAPNPQSAYGRTKLAGEQAIIQSGLDKYFIIRTSWLYGPGGNNFVETILRLAEEREQLRIVADQIGSPTYTGDLADAIFRLLNLSASPQPPDPSLYGTYHFANEGSCSWYEFACEIVTLAKLQGLPIKTQTLLPIRTEEYPLPAPRPAYSVFSKDKYLVATGAEIPGWKDSLANYLKSRNNL